MSAESTAPPAVPNRAAQRTRAILLLGAALLAAAALAIKALAEAVLSTGATTDLGPINIKLLYNRGVAFSFGAGLPAWVVIAATGLIIAALTWYIVASAPTMARLSRTGSALLLGGAGGNFIDRLDGQGVVDYLHTGWFPTFNLADIFVTVGAGLFILGALSAQLTAPGRTKTEQ